MDKYFKNQMIIFGLSSLPLSVSLALITLADTTLCGDWAGTSYSQAGCPGSCIQRVMDPSHFIVRTIH